MMRREAMDIGTYCKRARPTIRDTTLCSWPPNCHPNRSLWLLIRDLAHLSIVDRVLFATFIADVAKCVSRLLDVDADDSKSLLILKGCTSGAIFRLAKRIEHEETFRFTIGPFDDDADVCFATA